LTPDNTGKILIRAVNWIGDAVMTTPAIGVIREYFPQSKITLLANPMVSQLFYHHPWVDRVITFDRHGTHRGVIGRVKLAGELRKESFDTAIILPNSFDSAIVPFLAGIPVRVGKVSDGRGFTLTGRYHRKKNGAVCHEVEYYLELLRHFGISGSVTQPYLYTLPGEDHSTATLLAEQGIRQEDFLIGINPGATYGSAKRWYPERFAEVAGRLASEWSAKVLLLGGPGEAEITSDIEKKLQGTALNMAGKTSVRELMALIKRCQFFVTNDSGPMHIAAAFGIPLVAIFGSTDHATTSPYSDKGVVVCKPAECAPCKLRECPTDHRCMTAVTADDVVDAAKKLFAETVTWPT